MKSSEEVNCESLKTCQKWDGVENDPHRKMIPILKSENDPHIYFGNNFEENDPHTKKGNDPHIYFGKILKENYTHAIAFSDIT